MPDKTALQQLKDWYNEYRDEYKANPTYFEVMVKIEKLLPVERDAIVEAHKAGDPFNNIHDAEQYYENSKWTTITIPPGSWSLFGKASELTDRPCDYEANGIKENDILLIENKTQ